MYPAVAGAQTMGPLTALTGGHRCILSRTRSCATIVDTGWWIKMCSLRARCCYSVSSRSSRDKWLSTRILRSHIPNEEPMLASINWPWPLKLRRKLCMSMIRSGALRLQGRGLHKICLARQNSLHWDPQAYIPRVACWLVLIRIRHHRPTLSVSG